MGDKEVCGQFNKHFTAGVVSINEKVLKNYVYNSIFYFG